MNLNQQLSSQSQTIPQNEKRGCINRWLIYAFLAVSLLGFFDATYLTVKHYTGGAINCSILDGCHEVTTSKYATVAGVPLSLAGLIFYLTVFISTFIYLDTKREFFIKLPIYLTWFAFAASLYLVYLQVFVIEALCFYCLISATTSLLLFVLGLFMLKYRGSNKLI